MTIVGCPQEQRSAKCVNPGSCYSRWAQFFYPGPPVSQCPAPPNNPLGSGLRDSFRSFWCIVVIQQINSTNLGVGRVQLNHSKRQHPGCEPVGDGCLSSTESKTSILTWIDSGASGSCCLQACPTGCCRFRSPHGFLPLLLVLHLWLSYGCIFEKSDSAKPYSMPCTWKEAPDPGQTALDPHTAFLRTS